jgi:hypothetical protein
LLAVFAIVLHFKLRRRTKKLLRQAFKPAKLRFDKNADPFAAIIRCTSGNAVDNKMISKWARALRYAAWRKPEIHHDGAEQVIAFEYRYREDCSNCLNDLRAVRILRISRNIFPNRKSIIEFAAQYRVPAIYGLLSTAAEGGLIYYSVDSAYQYQQTAGYVGQDTSRYETRRIASATTNQILADPKRQDCESPWSKGAGSAYHRRRPGI